MKQGIELGYDLKEKSPIQIAFLSHDPLNLKQDVEINGNDYTVSKIERTPVMHTSSMTMFATTSFAHKNYTRMFCVTDMEVVYDYLDLEIGEHEMFLHICDIKE